MKTLNTNFASVTLAPLEPEDRPQFKRDLQVAFMSALPEPAAPESTALPIPSDDDIDHCFAEAGAMSFHILSGGRRVGGAVLVINEATHRNSLAFFFVQPQGQGRSIGYQAWQLLEARFPETVIWETHTPYFDKRNIHFYVNKCGFSIVEFFNERHTDPHDTDAPDTTTEGGMFRFEKKMREPF